LETAIRHRVMTLLWVNLTLIFDLSGSTCPSVRRIAWLW